MIRLIFDIREFFQKVNVVMVMIMTRLTMVKYSTLLIISNKELMPLLFNRFQTDIKLVEVEVVGEDSDIKTSIFFMDFRFFYHKKLITKMDIFNPSLMKEI